MDSNKFINQEIQMQYLVSVDRNGSVAHLTRCDCEGSSAVDGSDDDMQRNDSEEDGMLGVSVRKMKALTVRWRQ